MLDEAVQEEETAGAMCLPMCADRHYTSHAAHMGLLFSAACTLGFFASSALVLVLSPLITAQDVGKQELLVKIVSGTSAVGLGSAVSTGFLFFCGTKKTNAYEEVDIEVAAGSSAHAP